jgi:hypothetical protein
VGPGGGTGDAWDANISCGAAPTPSTPPQAAVGKRLRLCGTSLNNYYTPTLTSLSTYQSYDLQCFVVGEDIYSTEGLFIIYGDEGACTCDEQI